MKVLRVNNGKGWSGGQEHLKDLATDLRRHGVDVHFEARGDTVNETRFKALEFPVHLTPFKHGRESVKAFSRLVSAMRRERFDADRALGGPIEDKVRQLGIDDKVVFTGLVPGDRITDVFYDMDLSVTTHRNEGFGIVHLESLAAGTQVVAFDEGGFVDIFKGEEVGVLVDGGPAEFAQAVVDLLAHHGKRVAMGAAGHELVRRRYSVQAMGRTYLDFYRRLLGSPAA